MIYSGLDWSGSPGDVFGPWLVFAIVHVGGDDLPTLESELAAAAARLRWPTDFVFKHQRANKSGIHEEFYNALARIPFKAHVHMLNKPAWAAQYGGKGSSGDDCICDGMTSLLLGCPAELTEDQILYIDIPHKERTAMTKYREVIRTAQVGADIEPFRRIKARPDDRRDGGIIQIADMLAGEVAEHGGIAGPFLTRVSAHIRRV